MRLNNTYKTELKKQIDTFLPYTDKTNTVNKERIRSFLQKIIEYQLQSRDEPFQIDVKALYAQCAYAQEYDDILAKAYKTLSSIENNCGTMAKVANTPSLCEMYGTTVANDIRLGYTNLKTRLRNRIKSKKTPQRQPHQNTQRNPSTASLDEEIEEDDYTQPLQEHEIPQNDAPVVDDQPLFPVRTEFYNTNTDTHPDQESTCDTTHGLSSTKKTFQLSEEGLHALEFLKEWSLQDKLGDNQLVAQMIEKFIFSSIKSI